MRAFLKINGFKYVFDTENCIKKNKKNGPRKDNIQRKLETGKDTFWNVPEWYGHRDGLGKPQKNVFS